MNITGTNSTEVTENPMTENAMSEFTNDLDELRASLKDLGRVTDHCVHHYAWASVSLAAALGICVGLLIGGPGHRD